MNEFAMIARAYREERALDDSAPDLSQDALALDMGRQGWDDDARFVASWGKWLFWTAPDGPRMTGARI